VIRLYYITGVFENIILQTYSRLWKFRFNNWRGWREGSLKILKNVFLLSLYKSVGVGGRKYRGGTGGKKSISFLKGANIGVHPLLGPKWTGFY